MEIGKPIRRHIVTPYHEPTRQPAPVPVKEPVKEKEPAK